MPNPQNLKPFVKGDPRINRKGQPRKLPRINDLLAEVLGEDEKSSAAKAILEAILKKAKRGDVKAAELLLNRAYGSVKQVVSVEAKVLNFKDAE